MTFDTEFNPDIMVMVTHECGAEIAIAILGHCAETGIYPCVGCGRNGVIESADLKIMDDRREALRQRLIERRDARKAKRKRS